jgi:hypothetical protein
MLAIDDELAAKLRPQAVAQNLTIEQFALKLLDIAASNGNDDWRTRNQQRIALIRKQFTQTLTGEEEAQLAVLQEAADRHLEEMDEQLLADVKRLRSSSRRAN